MFDREQLEDLRQQVRTQAARGAPLLDQLLAQAQEMADDVRTIRPRQGRGSRPASARPPAGGSTGRTASPS